MKTKLILSMLLCMFFTTKALSQELTPKITFTENPLTHNMHIASDGKYYYTCNGGKANKGQVNKFNLKGELIQSYDIKLDMRSIMYNPKDKSLYIYSYDQNMYKVTDLASGTTQVYLENIFDEGQATPALSPDGKYFYFLKSGEVYVFDFKTGLQIEAFSDILAGTDISGGEFAIAVDKKCFYTFNSEKRLVYVYSRKGKLKGSFKISQGDYGFSLSSANKLIFVSNDGNYETGTWFGYKPEY
jgi:DNA-binding beta-propeller fold protein YncE